MLRTTYNESHRMLNIGRTEKIFTIFANYRNNHYLCSQIVGQ